MKNKTKFITCIGCSKFCRSFNEKDIKKIISECKQEGFQEAIFSCETFKEYFNELAGKQMIHKYNHDIKIGIKDRDGGIAYL